jgi:hypothetical protein
MATNCAGLVNSPDDPEALGYAISGIQEAVDMLNLRLWSWQIRTSGFPLVVGQTDYYFPSSVRGTRNMSLKNGSQRQPVGYLDPKSFMLETPSALAGDATQYTLMSASNSSSFVRLSHAPTSDSMTTFPSGELTYYERITYPTNTASGIEVPPEVERVIMEFARAYTAERFDPPKAELPQKRFEQGYRQLRVNESLNESSDWDENDSRRVR